MDLYISLEMLIKINISCFGNDVYDLKLYLNFNFININVLIKFFNQVCKMHVLGFEEEKLVI